MWNSKARVAELLAQYPDPVVLAETRWMNVFGAMAALCAGALGVFAIVAPFFSDIGDIGFQIFGGFITAVGLGTAGLVLRDVRHPAAMTLRPDGLVNGDQLLQWRSVTEIRTEQRHTYIPPQIAITYERNDLEWGYRLNGRYGMSNKALLMLLTQWRDMALAAGHGGAAP